MSEPPCWVCGNVMEGQYCPRCDVEPRDGPSGAGACSRCAELERENADAWRGYHEAWEGYRALEDEARRTTEQDNARWAQAMDERYRLRQQLGVARAALEHLASTLGCIHRYTSPLPLLDVNEMVEAGLARARAALAALDANGSSSCSENARTEHEPDAGKEKQ